jgi:hypothetical protein
MPQWPITRNPLHGLDSVMDSDPADGRGESHKQRTDGHGVVRRHNFCSDSMVVVPLLREPLDMALAATAILLTAFDGLRSSVTRGTKPWLFYCWP